MMKLMTQVTIGLLILNFAREACQQETLSRRWAMSNPGNSLESEELSGQEPEDESGEEPEDENDQEPEDGSGQEPELSGQEPEDESDQEPEGESDQEPEDGSGQEPEEFSGREPEDESDQEPEDENDQEPEDGSDQEPELSGQEPEDESDQEPEDESGQEPEELSGREPEDESDQEPEDESDQGPEVENDREPEDGRDQGPEDSGEQDAVDEEKLMTVDAAIGYHDGENQMLEIFVGDKIHILKNKVESKVQHRQDFDLPLQLRFQAAFNAPNDLRKRFFYGAKNGYFILYANTTKKNRFKYSGPRRFIDKGGPDAAGKLGEEVYLFKGCRMAVRYKWNKWGKAQDVRSIGLPCRVDAAWSEPQGMVILKGDQFWVWNKDSSEVSGPTPFHETYRLMEGWTLKAVPE